MLLRMIRNALCRLTSPLQMSGNSRDSSADIRSCVRRLCAAASSRPYAKQMDKVKRPNKTYRFASPSGLVPSTRRARNS
jgi:hypothetical protein